MKQEPNIRPAIRRLREKIESGEWESKWTKPSRSQMFSWSYGSVRFCASPKDAVDGGPKLEATWNRDEIASMTLTAVPIDYDNHRDKTSLDLTEDEEKFLWESMLSRLPANVRENPIKVTEEERFREFEEKYLS